MRTALTLQTDIRYRDEGDRAFLDTMIPDGEGPFPVVVCIHGGGWVGGNKEMLYPYGEILLEMGIASVYPLYRVTGTHPHPAQEQDIFAVLGWIAEHAAEYRFDARRVGLTGASAGGHLTALVGIKATRRKGLPYTVRCILPVCPPTDMASFAEYARANPDLLKVIEALIGGPIDRNAANARDVSPIHHVHRDAPPCLVTHGADDTVVPPAQAEHLVEALRKLKVPAEAIIVPGVGHAAHMPDTDPPEPLGGRSAFQAFFRKHLLGA